MRGIEWMPAAGWLALVGALAAAGAWLARRHALRRGLLDLPGERRSHATPTPRGGGIGIVLAWLGAILALATAGVLPGPLALAVVAGGALVGGAGFADDHRPLSPWWRLAAHVAAGLLLGAGLWSSGAAPWLAAGAALAVPIMVNVWNFMDGIDGLAASQAALAAGGFAWLGGAPAAAWPAAALAAACLGFLPFNFPRARIFLGDVGSGLLGYALVVPAALLLEGREPAGAAALLPVVFLPLSAFLLDATLTLGRRIVRGERWWTAHVGHAYQRLAARGGSHVPVTLAYAAWTVAAVAVAGFSMRWGAGLRMAAAAGCAALGILAWRMAMVVSCPPQQKDRR